MSDVVDKSETESALEKKEEEAENEVEEKEQPLRENMINNAVKFLSHDSVKNTPLVRRVAFLEQKGLTSAEITEAMRRVSSPTTTNTPTTVTTAQPSAPVRESLLPRRTPLPPPPPPPPPPTSNFKVIGTSVFLTLTAVGGVYWLLNKALSNANSTPQSNTTKQPSSSDSSNNLQTQMTELVQELRTQRLEVNDTLKMVHNVLSTPERAPQKSSTSSIDQVNVKELTAAINGLQSLLKETQLNQPNTPNNNLVQNRPVAQSPGTPLGSTTPLRAKPNNTIAQPPTITSNSNNTVRQFTPPVATPVVKNPPPTRSIAEITEMVKNGVEIPGFNPLLNDSPLDNTSVASQSSTERPIKPWQERRQAKKPQALPTTALPSYLASVKNSTKSEQEEKIKIETEIIETEKEDLPQVVNTEEIKNEESE